MKRLPPPPCRAAEKRHWRHFIDSLGDEGLMTVVRGTVAVDRAVDGFRKPEPEDPRHLLQRVRPS
jgi:hypothetical protein